MTSPRRGASQRNPLSPPQGRRCDVDKCVGGRCAADLSLKGALCSLVAQLFSEPPYGEKLLYFLAFISCRIVILT